MPPLGPAPETDYVRLHITPLDADLANVIIPASVRPRSRNLSFHTIETFPDKPYGFVELPRMDADRLKNKLNGSLLKGSRIRVEDARPVERVEPTGGAARPEKKRKMSADKAPDSSSKSRHPNSLDGLLLKDRKVKRGWTETPSAKKKTAKDGQKRQKSRYTDKEECLLKLKVPPNATANLPAATKKNKKKSRDVVVHEFEKTTKFPNFLKTAAPDTDGKAATEYVEGKGWVDEDGRVMEKVKDRRAVEAAVSVARGEEGSGGIAGSGVTSPDEASDDDDTSSSGTSSEDETEDDDAQESPCSSREQAQKSCPTGKGAKEGSSPPPSSPKSLTIKIPRLEPHPSVHPLEALYKRPPPGSETAEAASQPEPFSFFGGPPGDEDDTQAAAAEKPATHPASKMPMTPFTRQDFERRGIRSAAPTPDTAHPSRRHLFWASKVDADAEADGGHDDDDEEDFEGAPPPKEGQSDFQSWFWENRRELNRSWMTRRKTVAKERRHRENQARTSKAA
ncbi:suppressor protein srp40 protein [Ophiocordyceps camponoti-floridani]|uniref:Suppressor protein srp40 protein n=1 Tax=Ophiocordyceps camponoti-floridani TaxID=2030778 RepID=A0A8H4QDI1_9HYPO|nr:suppressor protein srp40 protein [Ophiocordyceps camponoti-floridani]